MLPQLVRPITKTRVASPRGEDVETGNVMMRKKGEVVKMIELVSQMMMRSEHAEVVEMIDAESRMTSAAKEMMKMVNESVSVKIAAERGVIGDNERAKRKIVILTL